MEMLLTGDMVSAARAAEIGLINKVVAPNELKSESMALAKKISEKSGLTLALGKSAFYRQKEMALKDAYIYSAQVMVKNMMAHDAKEGIDAFIKKRKPIWLDE